MRSELLVPLARVPLTIKKGSFTIASLIMRLTIDYTARPSDAQRAGKIIHSQCLTIASTSSVKQLRIASAFSITGEVVIEIRIPTRVHAHSSRLRRHRDLIPIGVIFRY